MDSYIVSLVACSIGLNLCTTSGVASTTRNTKPIYVISMLFLALAGASNSYGQADEPAALVPISEASHNQTISRPLSDKLHGTGSMLGIFAGIPPQDYMFTVMRAL